jgi:hypothetical protein
MVASLAEGDVELDVRLQLQTDPHLMPSENNAVLWPEKLPEHRPLGNQSRARRRMYLELSRLRQRMNGVPHYEPTGDEVFD